MSITSAKEFKLGQVWFSPTGAPFRVVSVDDKNATLKSGYNGDGYKIYKGVMSTKRWKLYNGPNPFK